MSAMTQTPEPEHIVDQELRDAVEAAVRALPPGVLSEPLAASLRTPTLPTVRKLSATLLAGSHLSAADTIFAALLARPDAPEWAIAGSALLKAARGDREGAARAWRECLERFPESSQPALLCDLAFAEGALSANGGAESLLRDLAGRFPRFAPALAALASLLEDQAREPVSTRWREVLHQFPEGTEPAWLLPIARIVEFAGGPVARAAVLDELTKRFPDNPAVIAKRAAAAAANEDWPCALELWSQLIDRQPAAATPGWLSGRAEALFGLGRAEEALATWTQLIERAPEFFAARFGKAAALCRLGHYQTAIRELDELVERLPQLRRADQFRLRADCLLQMRLDDADVAADLDRTIADLEAHFPESPWACRHAIRRVHRDGHSLAALVATTEQAVLRFPADEPVLTEWLRVLLAQGRFSEAESIVRRLECGERESKALVGRWNLTINRDGEAAIAESVRRSLVRRDWNAQDAAAIGDFLLTQAPTLVNDDLVSLLRVLGPHPGQISIRVKLATALIVLRRDDEALRLIDAIPAICVVQKVLELRAWAHARRDEDARARDLWARIVASTSFPALHASLPNLELVTDRGPAGGNAGVTVFTPIRNELANLPWFLAHYRRLGARRFVFVDNLSSDGSDAYLSTQPDVILYRTADRFADAGMGMRWINVLIERHGQGGWCLFADADEALIYPGWEHAPLERLTAFLEHEGAEGFAAPMVDVYPETSGQATGRSPSHADCRYFDCSYTWLGHIRPPYLRPVGGARIRIFGAEEYLHKIPLIKSGRTLYIGNHETTHLRLAPISGAHLHYKVLDLIRRYAGSGMGRTAHDNLSERGVHGGQRYSRYGSKLNWREEICFHAPGRSATLTDSLAMAEQGLMRVTPEYLRWINAH